MGNRYRVYADDEFGDPLDPQPMLVAQEDLTNVALWSRDLTNAIWTHNGAVTTAYTEIGINGKPNTATLVTDDSAALEYLSQSIASLGQLQVFVSLIKKDSTTDRWVELALQSLGGNNEEVAYFLNTSTGELKPRIAGEYTVVDFGDWWKVLMSTNGNNNNSANIYVIPAASLTGDARDSSATGSCIVGNIEVYSNKTIEQVINAGPIFTEGSAVTTGVKPTFAAANWSNEEGPFSLEFDYPTATDMSIISLGGVDVLTVEDRDVVVNGTFDTNIDNWGLYDTERGTIEWSASTIKVLNSTGTGSTYIKQKGFFSISVGETINLSFDQNINDTSNQTPTIYLIRADDSVGTNHSLTTNGAFGWKTLALQFVADIDAVGFLLIGQSNTHDYFLDNIILNHSGGKQLTLTDQTNTVSLPMPTPPAVPRAAILYEQGVENGGGLEFTGSEYGTLSTPATFTGDFEIEVEFLLSFLGGVYYLIIDSSGMNTCTIQIRSTNFVRFIVYDTTQTTIEVSVDDVTPLSANIRYKLKVKKVGNTYSTQIDNNTITSKTRTDVYTPIFDEICNYYFESNRFSGNLYSIKFKDLVNPVNNQTYTFNTGDTVQLESDEGGDYCVFTNIDSSNWLQGNGTMQLMLDDTYSAETTFDNEFAPSGNIVIGATSREIKRWNAALYFSGSQYVDLS